MRNCSVSGAEMLSRSSLLRSSVSISFLQFSPAQVLNLPHLTKTAAAAAAAKMEAKSLKVKQKCLREKVDIDKALRAVVGVPAKVGESQLEVGRTHILDCCIYDYDS